MALPHYRQDQTRNSGSHFEPVLANFFEVTILPPAPVSGGPKLLQHVNSISGLETLHPEVSPVEQKYKWSTRSYPGVPDGTAKDITINFSLNLNDSNQAYVYKTIRQWYRLGYNPETGETGRKRDCVGTIIVNEYDRVGDIYRTVTLEDCFITSGLPFNGELNYDTTEASTMEVTWRSDVYREDLA